MTMLRHERAFPGAGDLVEGAPGLRRTERGLRPARLPDWARRQVLDPFFDLEAELSAGARLALRTEATHLELALHAVRVPGPGGGPAPAAVDLEVDDRLLRREPLTGGDLMLPATAEGEASLVAGRPQTVRFPDLPAGEKEIRLWLPHTAVCDLLSLRADRPVRPSRQAASRPRWVHHGSSISHCAEAAGPTGMWPAVAARARGLGLTNLGFAANAMLDPCVARVIRDLPADLISLELGVNIVGAAAMRLRTFRPAVHGFLDTIREKHPEVPMVVVSPVPCPALEDRPGPLAVDPATGRVRAVGDPRDAPLGALTLSAARDHLARIVQERQHSDPALLHLDGRMLLKPEETADLHDGLHPNAAAYLRMGSRFAGFLTAAHGEDSHLLHRADAR
ncbi:GDSL-type esterase/lipase family protein [Streptomyces peucetius]|uniref:Lipase n=1 Tax=Streptomyces peucetius TaxID=1950 RepID=A0ABY6IDT5_STRPE|nr:GDSL-type esterase/lipase family protein [Streptomyces peucetius]UYQ65183.1 lipase [Streptomyces peucetius]